MISYSKLIDNAKKKIDLNGLEHRAIYLFLEDILNVDRTQLLLMRDELVEEDILEKFSEKLADYIIDEIPIEYILGYTYFYGNKIKVDNNVLIPRDETEELVEKALTYIKDGHRVLDLCTGSGAIAVAIKGNKHNIEMVASDISKGALKVAKENSENLNCEIEFVEGDLLYPFILKNEKFDVIVSNPPYISRSFEVNNIVKHEPEIALYANNDGLENYEIIIKNLDKVMNDKGVVLFEIGYDQGKAILDLCEKYLNKCTARCLKDISGNDRIVIIELL
jgi:release factor glutamine methyltransferase